MSAEPALEKLNMTKQKTEKEFIAEANQMLNHLPSEKRKSIVDRLVKAHFSQNPAQDYDGIELEFSLDDLRQKLDI